MLKESKMPYGRKEDRHRLVARVSGTNIAQVSSKVMTVSHIFLLFYYCNNTV